MKQTVLMLVLLAVGTVGPFAFGPFIGVAVYYLFAVLRPQFLWKWALWFDPGCSFYVSLATIGATVVYLSSSLWEKTFSWAHYVMLSFALFVTLSHLFAIYGEISSGPYWEYLKIFIMFFVASLAVRELVQVKILYLIAAFAIGYIAYEFNYLYLVDHRLDIYHQGYGGLDNNGAGLLIAMGIPMFYFLWQSYDRWWRWLFLALIAVMLHAVLMSYSRGAMVALLTASPLLVVRSARKKGMILFVAGTLCMLPILAGKEIRERFFSVEQYEEDRSAQSRLASWNAAWEIAKDYPILGVGLRNADLLSHKYGVERENKAIHSVYFQTLADSGFPAAVLYLLLLFSSWKALRAVRLQHRTFATESDQLAYNLACGIEGALAVFSIGAAFLSLQVFELPYLLILLALKLGMISHAQKVPATSPDSVPELAGQARSFARA